ncbi:polysaccharide export outer membrane protein [Draconibacterium orientale]|uniref:Polysaccharide export outer membrane protein n=1 Tax=Draconibacterium orientale TaxID=1168034 RepID=X5DM00_9BACT|nr:polysaccharide biosynthesis/export family protein [Draconibacterium orientale]AHW62269.1 hypothetical protein FH5T_18630 [Draconibacterium orientale]SET86510.1 polysaccharide export outer membrane protein [Draconibacterium orientale]
MKKRYIFYLCVSSILIQTACSNTKNITMFQTNVEKADYFQVPGAAPEHKIKPYDNLYLSILTLDSEVNKLFNPSLAGNGIYTGTQQMFGDPTSKYINGYRVSADSTIILPILGKIKLVDLTLDQAEDRVMRRAQEYLKEPTVQVKLLNFKVNISGEVKNPGIYYNYEGSLNILDALSEANGYTDFADLSNVTVKRHNGNRIYTHKVDFTNNSIYSSNVFYLQPNDMVYIPPSKLKRRNVNSDTYSKLLGTLSVLLVAASIFAL